MRLWSEKLFITPVAILTNFAPSRPNRRDPYLIRCLRSEAKRASQSRIIFVALEFVGGEPERSSPDVVDAVDREDNAADETAAD
jgi:hypothetical protein